MTAPATWEQDPDRVTAEPMVAGASGAPDLAVPVGPKARAPETLNAMAHRHYQQWVTGDGSTTEFALDVTVLRLEDVKVFRAGLLLRPSDRGTAYDYQVRGLTPGFAGDSNRVRFTAAPGMGVAVCFDLVGG